MSGALATGVLELTQTLTKYNQELQQRAEEKARLSRDHAECRKRLSWQQQRAHGLRRNVERLFNETNWLNTKTAEVAQDAQLLAHEIRRSTVTFSGYASSAGAYSAGSTDATDR